MNNAICTNDIIKIVKAVKIKRKNWDRVKVRIGRGPTLRKFLKARTENRLIGYFGEDLDMDVSIATDEICVGSYRTEYDRIEALEAAVELGYPLDVIEEVLFEPNPNRFEIIMAGARERYL